MNKYFLFASINVLISSLTQILLKSSAKDKKNNFISNYLNLKVFISYSILFIIMFLNSYYIFKYIDLNQIAIIESLGYIFVPILSYISLGEKMKKYKIIGVILIIVGIVIFNI